MAGEGKWIDEYNRQYAEHMDYVNGLKQAYKSRWIDELTSLSAFMIILAVIMGAVTIVGALVK